MGNSLIAGGRRKRTKVMKINGESFKLSTPVRAWDVVKDYPGHVLLESESVKVFGIRAKPLEPQEELKAKKVYFLVEFPKFPEEMAPPRRVRSSIHMSAKDRLECLMLSRRSVSDLSIVKPAGSFVSGESGQVPVRVRLLLPKAQVAKLVAESRDGVEAAERIVDFYMENAGEVDGEAKEGRAGRLLDRPVQRKSGLGSVAESFKVREKQVVFVPTKAG